MSHEPQLIVWEKVSQEKEEPNNKPSLVFFFATIGSFILGLSIFFVGFVVTSHTKELFLALGFWQLSLSLVLTGPVLFFVSIVGLVLLRKLKNKVAVILYIIAFVVLFIVEMALVLLFLMSMSSFRHKIETSWTNSSADDKCRVDRKYDCLDDEDKELLFCGASSNSSRSSSSNSTCVSSLEDTVEKTFFVSCLFVLFSSLLQGVNLGAAGCVLYLESKRIQTDTDFIWTSNSNEIHFS